jgi:N-acetyl-anhydromuramyl-L-alanine amidase AmpD
MTLDELQEQLQENMLTVLDNYMGYEIDSLMIDKVCQIIVATFNDNFYDATMSGVEIVSKND